MDICSTPSTSLLSFEYSQEQQQSFSTKYSNFNYFAIGNEVEKLKWLVLHHVNPSTFKRIFEPMMNNKKCNKGDELTCIEACMLLNSIHKDKRENACYGLITLLNTETLYLYSLDKIITKILITAADEKIITLLQACQLLVTSIDFRMERRPNPEKLKFMRKSMEQMDYKDIRDLLKLLLVEKLNKMYCQLNEYQHKQLEPIEELVIDLIDRKKNFCPALFFITEVSRIDTDFSSIHFLPRVSLKIREMVASFRPLAEIGCMIGRSWMWPIPSSPIFSWNSPTWTAWKLDEKHCKLYFKTHLPYNSETSSPQTYLQYILFKQPHGQDNLNHILLSSNPKGTSPKLQCDEVIQLLILEAMSAMEDCEQPVLAPINQYNWLHLSHLVTYALSMGHCTLSQLLMMLLPQLKSCQYLHAKEELMWILLQYIAYAKSKEKYAHQQHQQQGGTSKSFLDLPSNCGLGVQNRELVLEIFNVLYTDKSMNWGNSCSTEQPLEMVRFFAPAAIWSHLVTSLSTVPGSEQIPQPQPPEKLKKLLEFIENQLRENKNSKQLERNSALLAVVANAYSNNQELFDEHVNNTVFPELAKTGQQKNQTNPPSSSQSVQQEKWALPSDRKTPPQQEKWSLPGGRKTEPFLRALELTFLDSLTFHAKRQIYNHSISRIYLSIIQHHQSPPVSGASIGQQQHNPSIFRLPSPALVESIARLLLSTELCDPNGSQFYRLAFCNLKPPHNETENLFFARNDFLSLLLQLLNYRLQNIGFGWKCDINNRTTFIISIIDQILNNQNIGQSPLPVHIQLSQLFEQTILRFAQCTFPHDILIILQHLWSIFPKMFELIPEISRSFIFNTILRSSKLLGDVHKFANEGQMFHNIMKSLDWQWPKSEIQLFPNNLQKCFYEFLEQNEKELIDKQTKKILEIEQASSQEMQHLFHLNIEYFVQRLNIQTPQQQQPPPPLPPPTLFISIFRCLYQFQLPNFQFPNPVKPPHPSAPTFSALCYKILILLGNKELNRLTNSLIDWLAFKCGWLGQDISTPTQGIHDEYDLNLMVRILNEMIFSHQFLSIDRVLFSIALHPTDDQSSKTLFCILAAILESKFSQFSERLHACYSFAPSHSQTTISNSEEFFVQMVEYYKKYPEYSFSEKYRKYVPQAPPESSKERHNLPIYYGHLAERICPIVDILLQKAIFMDLKPAIMDTLFCHFSPIYRIHPQPMNFLYTTLYSLDGLSQQQQENANNCQSFLNRPIRKFVLEIVLKLEQEEIPQTPHGRTPSISKLLTTEFIQLDHQMPAIKFCRILVDRIVRASTYTHQPPFFVHSDWRFAEFAPAAQALTSAWVELLASRHSAIDIVDALVQLAIRRPISRPQDTLNALGLLLTGLPSSFQSAFLDKVEQSFDWDQISRSDSDPAQLFESLSSEVYLHSESRILSMLALFHSFCQHGGNNSISIIPDFVVNRLAHKVQNEAQLIYFLRIVVPYLQRIAAKHQHMDEIVAIYKVLGNLTQKVGRLQYEDTICDLLYQFKYMYVGYLLKDKTEETICSFPESMREKLKFLLTHSSQHQSSFGSLLLPPHATAITAVQQQQQQQLFQQQSFDQQQISSSTPALTGMIRRLSRTENEAATIMQQYGAIIPNVTNIQGEQPTNFGNLNGITNIQMLSSQQQQQQYYSSNTNNFSTNFLPNQMIGNIPNSSFSAVQNTNQGIQQQQQIVPPPPYPQQQQQSNTSMGILPNSAPFPGPIPSSSNGNMNFMMGQGSSNNFGPGISQPFTNSNQIPPNQMMSFATFQQQQQQAQQQHLAAQMSSSHGPIIGGNQQPGGGSGQPLPQHFPPDGQGGF